jgi:hypothetical protein
MIHFGSAGSRSRISSRHGPLVESLGIKVIASC